MCSDESQDLSTKVMLDLFAARIIIYKQFINEIIQKFGKYGFVVCEEQSKFFENYSPDILMNTIRIFNTISEECKSISGVVFQEDLVCHSKGSPEYDRHRCEFYARIATKFIHDTSIRILLTLCHDFECRHGLKCRNYAKYVGASNLQGLGDYVGLIER